MDQEQTKTFFKDLKKIAGESRENQFLNPIQTYKYSARAEKAMIENNKEQKGNFFMFSTDIPEGKGEKYWHIATIDAFTDLMFSLPKENRYGNCLIQHAHPIIGYMDFEFQKEGNEDRDAGKMFEIFFKYFFIVWKKVFPDEKCPTLESFLILTASNQKKESFHVHGPFGYGFMDVYHFKSLLKLTMDELKKDKVSDHLLVLNSNKEKISFIDLAPYHSNCCFRMYQCCKTGDFRPMVLSKLNTMKLPDDEKEIFKMTIINNVPNDFKILKNSDIKLLKSIAPKIYNDNTKEITDILSNFKKCESFEECTHFDYMEKMKNFTIVDDIKSLNSEIKKNLQKNHLTHEKFTEKTRLMFEMPKDNILKKGGNEFYFKHIQTKVASFFPNESLDVITFRIGDGVRLVWPNIIIDKKEGSRILKDLQTELSKEHKLFEKCFVDPYQRDYLSLIGAQEYLKGPSFIVSFQGVFNEKGERKNMSIEDVIEKSSARINN